MRGPFSCCVCAFAIILGLPSLLGTEHRWPYALGFGAIFSLVKMPLIFYCPESPKFQFIKKGLTRAELARTVIYFQGEEANLGSIFDEFEAEKRLGKASRKSASLGEVLQTRHLRIPFFLAIASGAAARTGGYDVISNYSTLTLQRMGLDAGLAQWATVVVYAPILAAALFTIFYIERIGARRLMITGIALGAIGNFAHLCYFNYW